MTRCLLLDLLYFTIFQFEIFLIDKTFWIDVCQSNGNLLASGGSSETRIFDKRKSKIVNTFKDIHASKRQLNLIFITLPERINCVRWSPNGDMLASASHDTKVKLLDVKTGKVLYTGKTSDERRIIRFEIQSHFIVRDGYLSLLHLKGLERGKGIKEKVNRQKGSVVVLSCLPCKSEFHILRNRPMAHYSECINR